MGPFIVFVDDHSRYLDPSARRERGRFETLEQAEAACRALVDASLAEHLEPGITADELFRRYMTWGDDPFVVAPGDAPPAAFSARDYAKERCRSLATC